MKEIRLHRHEEAIEHLAVLTSSALITDRSSTLSPAAISFPGCTSQFEELLFRSLNAALSVLPYQYLLDIALHMQREDIQARGYVLPDSEPCRAA